MSTLLKEIITEIRSRNPQASTEEVSETVVRLIERDVLPAALREMRMPEPVSPAQQWRQKQFLQRVKLKRRKTMQARIEKSRRLVSEFEYIKREFRRIYVDASSSPPAAFYGDVTDTFWAKTSATRSVSVTRDRDTFSRRDGFSITDEKQVREKKKELSKLRLSLPMPKQVKEFEIFSIGKSVQAAVITDPIFAKNLSIIEKAARTFASESSFEIDFSVSLRTAIEIPEWRKLVLDVRTRGLDFDQKMKLWDEFDARVRNEIRQRMEVAEGTEKKKLEEMSKAFFTHFDLT